MYSTVFANQISQSYMNIEKILFNILNSLKIV